MSQIITSAPSALWKLGRNNNIEFLSSWKRLEKESPETYKMIEQKEGYICHDHEYEYKVGKNQYGLWLSRRKMGFEGLQNIESMKDERTPVRPQLTEQLSFSQEEIATLKQFAVMLKTVK